MQPVLWNADTEYPPAFAGMIADGVLTDKITVACGAGGQEFGTVVASVPGTGVSVLPAAANPLEGIALHAHHLSGRYNGQEGYIQTDAMAVGRRGRFWARAGGACTKDAVAKFDPANGRFADAGTATFPNAKFLSAMLTVPGVAGAGSQTIVLVELGSPVV